MTRALWTGVRDLLNQQGPWKQGLRRLVGQLVSPCLDLGSGKGSEPVSGELTQGWEGAELGDSAQNL